MILYIFSVFLPIVLTNVIFYQVTTNNVKKQKMDDLAKVMNQIKSDFQESIVHAVGVSSALYTDSKINEFLDKDYQSSADYIEAYDTQLRGFNKYTPVFSAIESIQFYSDNNTVVYSGGVNPISSFIAQENWYKELTRKPDSFPLVIKTGGTYQRDTISIIRELNFFKVYNSTKKIVKIDIDQDMINHIFNNANLEGELYLLNDKDQIEYTTDPMINWREEIINIGEISKPDKVISLEEKYDIDHFLTNWKIVAVLDESQLLDNMSESLYFLFFLAIFNIIVPTAIIIFISQSINLRLNKVLNYMKKMKNQSFETIDGIQYKDEIGQLTSEFNRMSRRINELINDVYVANIQKKDLDLQRKQAQISALQSQINPHFLFNALETIRMRSIIKKEDETAKIIQNMAKMLRKSFTWGRDWVTVKEELAVILSFLEIQKYRFDEKLEYILSIDEDAYEEIIPNMILLPFVENASIHGVEHKKEKGVIEIIIKRHADYLICEIKDNGPGIEEVKLHQLLESLKMEEAIGENVGIKNVYYRLKMYYGSDFHFDIKSDLLEGTTISVHLPSSKKAGGTK